MNLAPNSLLRLSRYSICISPFAPQPLTWAKFCLHLMYNWESEEVETILEGERVSKYQLLLTLKEVYNRHDIYVKPVDKPIINKCLEGNFKTSNLKSQLIDLQYFTNA